MNHLTLGQLDAQHRLDGNMTASNKNSEGRTLPAAHVLTGRKPMIRTFIIAAASAAVLTLSAPAFAQKPDYGTADEAKAMLLKAVVALKAD